MNSKSLILIFLSVFCLNAINAEVTWELSDDGTLTISGTGSMDNYYASYSAPWFSQRESIKNIIIKNGVRSIGDRAFSGCTGLTSITIPNSVEDIGWYAFEGCTGLTSVTIPNTVTSIGRNPFTYCSGLTSIKVESGNTYYDSRNDCNAIIGKNGDYLVSGCKATIIPNSVTSISDSAFEGCTDLTSITIPNSVTNIWGSAFEGCTGLKSIIIPNGVTKICDHTFRYCSSLTSITIPDCITYIGDEAFCDCSSLTSITIPNSVTRIGVWAFGSCYGLTSITIPNSVTSIDYYAFRDCKGLTSITIPNSVTSIGNMMFLYCSSLNKVTINVNKDLEIGRELFVSSGLKKLIMKGETLPKSTAGNLANGYYDKATLYVPASLYEEYRSTSPWSKFFKIEIIDDEEEDDVTGINNSEFEQSRTSNIYDVNGRKVIESTLKPGLYIKNGQKVVVK